MHGVKMELPNGKKPVTVLIRAKVALDENTSLEPVAQELHLLVQNHLRAYEGSTAETTTLHGWDE